MRDDRKHSRRFHTLFRTGVLGLFLIATQIASHPCTTTPKFSTIPAAAFAMNAALMLRLEGSAPQPILHSH